MPQNTHNISSTNYQYTFWEYSFGFQGQEMDGEVYGDGNALDFGARIYDPRLGRWMSCDPAFNKQPSMSPYKANLNNPIIYADPNGKTEYLTIIVADAKTGLTQTITVVKSSKIMTDGVPHMVQKGTLGSGGYQNQYNYYDYENVLHVTINEVGSINYESSTNIFSNRKPKSKTIWQKPKKGDIKTMDHRYSVKGGIMFTSSCQNGNPNQTVSAAYDVPLMNADLLISVIAGATKNGNFNSKSLPQVISFTSNCFKIGQNVVTTIDGVKEMLQADTESSKEKQYKVRYGVLNKPSQIDTVSASDTSRINKRGGEVLREVEKE